jgi:hypothetical protein
MNNNKETQGKGLQEIYKPFLQGSINFKDKGEDNDKEAPKTIAELVRDRREKIGDIKLI